MSVHKRVFYIHGSQTINWNFGWAPWVRDQLNVLKVSTHFRTMPDPFFARKKNWMKFLREQKLGRGDVLLGWSSGAIAAMRFAQEYEIGGSVLVSPYHSDLGNPLEKMSGWYRAPWDWESIRSNQKRIEVISGTDDPFIDQSEFREVAESLHANWTQVEGEGHFVKMREFVQCVEAVKRVLDEL